MLRNKKVAKRKGCVYILYMDFKLPVKFKLDDLLKEKGYTRQSFADKIGKKRQYVSRLAGEQPRLLDMELLALAYEEFGCKSFDEIFEFIKARPTGKSPSS